MQFFVDEIDANLFEPVLFEALETKDVKQTNCLCLLVKLLDVAFISTLDIVRQYLNVHLLN